MLLHCEVLEKQLPALGPLGALDVEEEAQAEALATKAAARKEKEQQQEEDEEALAGSGQARAVHFSDHVSHIEEPRRSRSSSGKRRKGSERRGSIEVGATTTVRARLDGQDERQANAIQWTFGRTKGAWVKAVDSGVESCRAMQVGDRLTSINRISTRTKSQADIASIWMQELEQRRFLELALSRPCAAPATMPAAAASQVADSGGTPSGSVP